MSAFSNESVTLAALGAYVGVAASAGPAELHIVATADLPGRSRPLGCGWRVLKLRWLYPLDRHRRLEPAQDRQVRIIGTAGPTVVLREAVWASGDGEAVWAAGDGPDPARECLVVEPGVRGGPVQVSSGQYVPPKLTVISDPIWPLVVVGCLEDGRLVSPEFWGFLRETCQPKPSRCSTLATS